MSSNATAKIALVTGASRGLGRNTAIALARKGSDVIGTYHSNRAEADATVAAIEALGRPGLPDDIGPAIAALLAEDNRWITAQRIEISGGMFT
jgi:NAD(P)-dependent dehydrogenase (short-subunit alcohol dehydrogenase family)